MKLHNNRELAVVTTAVPVNGRGITGSLGNFGFGAVFGRKIRMEREVRGSMWMSLWRRRHGGEGGVSGGDNVVRAGGDAEGVGGVGVEERGLG